MELTRHAQALKRQGSDFALRCYSHNAARNLSLGEARGLAQASHPQHEAGLLLV